MPAATKKRPINLLFKASTPARILRDLRTRYKSYVVEEEDDPLEDWFETDLHKRIRARMTPALAISHLRDAHGWSQARLAEEIGGVSAKRVSDWENERRAVSKDVAKKLARIFRVPAERFI